MSASWIKEEMRNFENHEREREENQMNQISQGFVPEQAFIQEKEIETRIKEEKREELKFFTPHIDPKSFRNSVSDENIQSNINDDDDDDNNNNNNNNSNNKIIINKESVEEQNSKLSTEENQIQLKKESTEVSEEKKYSEDESEEEEEEEEKEEREEGEGEEEEKEEEEEEEEELEKRIKIDDERSINFYILCLKALYEKKISLNSQNKKAQTPLMLAIKNKNFISVEFLLKLNVDLNLLDRYGRTSLHYAIKVGNLRLANKLLKYGIDFSSISDKHGSPIDYARKLNHQSIVDLLEQHLTITRQHHNHLSLQNFEINFQDLSATYLHLNEREEASRMDLSKAFRMSTRIDISDLNDEQRQRGLVISEIIETEKLFVQDLLLCIEKYMTGLNNKIAPKVHAEIFCNIEELYQCHQLILSRLNRMLSLFDTASYSFPIWKPYKEQIEVFREPHNRYCCTQDYALKRIKALRLDPKTHSLLESIKTDPILRSLDLESFIIKPVQRICKYPLLFKQLLSLTPENEESFYPIASLHQEFVNLLNTSNEAKRKFENQLRIREIQAHLVGCGIALAAEGRKFIRQGKLFRKTAEGKRSYQFFLFNDILIYALQKKTNLFSFSGIIPIFNIGSKNVPDDLKYNRQYEFEIFSRTTFKRYVFAAQDQQTKDSWLNDINELITEWKEKNKQVKPEISEDNQKSTNIIKGGDSEQPPKIDRNPMLFDSQVIESSILNDNSSSTFRHATIISEEEVCNFQKLGTIQNSIHGAESLNLVQSGRSFIYESPCDILSETSKKFKNGHIFLLSDSVLLVSLLHRSFFEFLFREESILQQSPSSQFLEYSANNSNPTPSQPLSSLGSELKFKLIAFIPLNQISLNTSWNCSDGTGFGLESKGKLYYLKTSSKVIRRNLLEQLTNQIRKKQNFSYISQSYLKDPSSSTNRSEKWQRGNKVTSSQSFLRTSGNTLRNNLNNNNNNNNSSSAINPLKSNRRKKSQSLKKC